jgi:hypothetical protein
MSLAKRRVLFPSGFSFEQVADIGTVFKEARAGFAQRASAEPFGLRVLGFI